MLFLYSQIGKQEKGSFAWWVFVMEELLGTLNNFCRVQSSSQSYICKILFFFLLTLSLLQESQRTDQNNFR